jgi:hypothetical protein
MISAHQCRTCASDCAALTNQIGQAVGKRVARAIDWRKYFRSLDLPSLFGTC